MDRILRIGDWPLTTKLVVFVSVVAVTAAVVGYLGINRSTQLLRHDAFEHEFATTEDAATEVEAFFEDLTADAVFMANASSLHLVLDETQARSTSEVLALIGSGSDPELNRARNFLAQDMIGLMQSRDLYSKLRFIDESGREIVEVTETAGQLVISPLDKLGDESEDDYVTEAIGLPAGEVFAGRFQYDTQGGVIIEPLTPTLRFSTPVYYQGRVRGVLVSNVKLANLLDPLLAEHSLITIDVNQDGMYLTNPDPSKVFGVDLDTGESFRNDFPDIADEIFSKSEGVVELPDGRYMSYRAAFPLDRPVEPEAEVLPGEMSTGSEVDPALRQWRIIAIEDLNEALAEVSSFRNVSLGVLVIVLAGSIIGAILVSQLLTRQVREIGTVFEAISEGDYQARSVVIAGDELGQMASDLNAVLDQTLTLIQTREERDAIQSSIVKLLEEVSGVAEGDLTIEAEITEDITGAIADSFNFMISQLRNIISDVQNATLEVSSSANQIRTTAEHLSRGSEQQSEQITATSAAIQEMALSIQQVSANAAVSANVGEQALTNAKTGTHAVRNTIDGMNRIRDQVQETAKRIKRLGESSQEVGEIVQLIGDIADRTSILALNASIQAAMAGEAGRGFAVVAEEVEQLADRSTEATKQIETLIRTIQNETTEAVAAMESTTNEVVQGSVLADEAGAALAEIEMVSNRLAELSQSISQAAQQQARGSESVAQAMQEISTVTQQTASGTKQAAISVNNLAVLADELRSSVSTFKLPGSNGTGPLRENGNESS